MGANDITDRSGLTDDHASMRADAEVSAASAEKREPAFRVLDSLTREANPAMRVDPNPTPVEFRDDMMTGAHGAMPFHDDDHGPSAEELLSLSVDGLDHGEGLPGDDAAIYASAYDLVAADDSLLSKIQFSDLYIELDGVAWYKRAPNDTEGYRLSGEHLHEVRDLCDFLGSTTRNADFRVVWRGMELRGDCLETLRGPVYTLRRLLPRAMAFDKIGYPPRLIEALLSSNFNQGGLVLFAGSTGAGKSTSMAAWLVERLNQNGGTAWTVENPIETDLQGRYERNGKVGICYQTEVKEDRDFGYQITRILRAAPNMIMLGELRTAEVAAKAVLAATSGHLVSATIHGTDIQAVLERVKNLVKESGYDISMFADSLCAVVHQSMTLERMSDGTVRRSIHPRPLIVSGSEHETPIRAQLRSGNLTQLISQIERQERLMHLPRTFGEF